MEFAKEPELLLGSLQAGFKLVGVLVNFLEEPVVRARQGASLHSAEAHKARGEGGEHQAAPQQPQEAEAYDGREVPARADGDDRSPCATRFGSAW